MNAEIIAVGSELLLGQIVNSNAQYISKSLADIGVNVFYHTVAGDNERRLSSAVETACSRSNLIIFTGGLGPTKDDLTKETIAKLFNKDLVHDETSLRYITNYFEQTNREMTENNKKQALIIKDALVLPNDNGMAPGMAFTQDEITFILLPGPPSEMKPMFINYAVPFLLSKMDVQTRLYSRVLKFFGIGESILETKLQDLIEKQTNPTIAPLASEHEVTIRLTAAHTDQEEAKKLLDETESEIVRRTSAFFYGYENDTLEKQTMDLLMKRNATVSSAESLTGGLFGRTMTDQPGSSSVFKGGIIAYSNELKKNLLSVPDSLIKEHGAVSEKCAEWMAEHIKKMAKTDYGISFTGVAGPEQQEEKPVGTIFIGLAGPQKTKVFPVKLAGTRKSIREKTVKHGLYLLNRLVKEDQ
jgi:nicotinamide-nucleotide amidase